jgi:ornithine decarboxylase
MIGLPTYASVLEMIQHLRPEFPVYCVDVAELRRNVRRFVEHFPGTTLYAVKCNPHPAVLALINDAGIDHFDVASIGEIDKVGKLFPAARMFYMHPVKTVSSITAAYREFGVRQFVVDHVDELHKIPLAIARAGEIATDGSGGAAAIQVFVRIKTRAVPGTSFVLSKKFGAEAEQAVALLREIDSLGYAAGIAFHVGSQCTTTAPYREALDDAHRIVAASGVNITAIDVGGGFPAYYPDVKAPDLLDYFSVIGRGLEQFSPAQNGIEVYCEPGRAIVASALSIVTQVHLRKDNRLYLNDGFYGSLVEANQAEGSIKLSGQTFATNGPCHGEPLLFSLYGPTCDSLDALGDAVWLDRNTATDNWVVFDHMGAYSNALVTEFNGFQSNYFVAIEDTGAE